MRKLRAESLNKCLSLLREFIEESPVQDNKKGIANLALGQLQKITAGTDPLPSGGNCSSIPRIDGSPSGGNSG